LTSFKTDIWSDLVNTELSIRFELFKYLKQKRLIIVLGLAIFISGLFYAIPEIQDSGFPNSAADFANTNLGFLNFLILIAAAIFAGDAISSEFEKKTGLMLFATPQRRTSIFVGKYISALIAIYLVVSLYFLVTAMEMAKVYGVSEISQEFFKSLLLALLYSTSVISVIFCFSSIFKRTITSSLIGFFLFLMIMPIISGALKGADIEPWFLVTYSAELIQDVLIVPNTVFYGPGRHSNAAGGFQPGFAMGVMVMVAYAIVFFIASIAIANRKGME
jgi:ABC-2 type transport system permease protein